jgi:hypothetical protein
MNHVKTRKITEKNRNRVPSLNVLIMASELDLSFKEFLAVYAAFIEIVPSL